MFFSRKQSIFAQAVAASVMPSEPPACLLPQNSGVVAQKEKATASTKPSHVPFVMVDDGTGALVVHERIQKDTTVPEETDKWNFQLTKRSKNFVRQSRSRRTSLAMQAFVTQVREDSGTAFTHPPLRANFTSVPRRYVVNDHDTKIPVEYGSDALNLIYIVENNASFRPERTSHDKRSGWEWGHTTVTVININTTNSGFSTSVWTNNDSFYSYKDVEEYRESNGYYLGDMAYAAGVIEEVG